MNGERTPAAMEATWVSWEPGDIIHCGYWRAAAMLRGKPSYHLAPHLPSGR